MREIYNTNSEEYPGLKLVQLRMPDKGCANNQRVGCLQLLGSRAFGPAKRSGPMFLSTVP